MSTEDRKHPEVLPITICPAGEPVLIPRLTPSVGFSRTQLFTLLFVLLYAGQIIVTLPRMMSGHTADFVHFYRAAAALAAGEDIYAVSSRHYIYPPLDAFLFQPLSALPISVAAGLWLIMNAVLLGASAWLTAGAAAARLSFPPVKSFVPSAAFLGSLLLLGKVHADLHLGQTDGLVIFPIVLALNCLDRRPILAGTLLGLAGAEKYFGLAYVPYLVLRKRWWAAGSTVVAWTAWMLLPGTLAGWNRNLHYIVSAVGGLVAMLNPDVGSERAGATQTPGTLAGISGVVWERSVSLTSACMRLGTTAAGKIWAIAALTVIAFACVALAWWLVRRARLTLWTGRGLPADLITPRRRALVLGEWSAVLIATLVFSPQLTERHFVLLLPIAVLAFFEFFNARRRIDRALIVIGSIFLLAGLYLPPGGIAELRMALWWWRDLGGASWCALVFLFLTLTVLVRQIAIKARPVELHGATKVGYLSGVAAGGANVPFVPATRQLSVNRCSFVSAANRNPLASRRATLEFFCAHCRSTPFDRQSIALRRHRIYDKIYL